MFSFSQKTIWQLSLRISLKKSWTGTPIAFIRFESARLLSLVWDILQELYVYEGGMNRLQTSKIFQEVI